MFGNTNSEGENKYFTLVFFPKTEGLKLCDSSGFFHQSTVWDTVFTSAASDLRIALSPKARGYCISIDLSTKWLHNNLFAGSESFKLLQERLNAKETFLLLECMTSAEKKAIQELLSDTWQKPMGTFYLKSSVLKIVYDFFHKINVEDSLRISSIHLDAIIKEVENHLHQHVTGKLPNTKELAKQFSISESTLKRHFAKRYGVSMSVFFIKLKMQYAYRLMQEEKLSITETAFRVGYSSVHNFLMMYRKHVPLPGAAIA
jgi:AraC-like DNA-binding protein